MASIHFSLYVKVHIEVYEKYATICKSAYRLYVKIHKPNN